MNLAERRSWMRILAGCGVLLAIVFVQVPGQMIADTKFDLVVAPFEFLGRALHLWDPEGSFGQLQNQAYGYLWPMGPFFALGASLGIAEWAVQRLWQGLVLCVAFIGTARLARAFGIRSDLACLVAAFAFALSPRIIGTLGPISIEAWPSAMAPWVLLPLVRGAVTGSPRRAALLSAVAIAMVGGVNAAATAAVLPLGVLWLLTRKPGPRRRAMMLWWPLFTALGTCWWLIPLFVMGAYSPPFLDFIESAAVTTFPATLFDSLRGTTAWVPYVESSWQGGNYQITNGYLALNSAVLIMVGLVGMVLPATRERQFLLLSLMLGVFLTTMGHTGSPQGWFAEPLEGLLDGLLAPMRNIHKFDPVVRLPLVLGLAWAVEAALAVHRARTSGRKNPVPVGASGIAFLVVVAVVGASAPALLLRLEPTGAIAEAPQHWEDTAQWLEANAPESVALVVPGSSFGEYRWGNVRDEPLQFLSAAPWAVRSAVPLTPPGNIRMLDTIEARLAQGHGSAGLASYLRRAGIGHLVVRNDLDPQGDAPHPALVRMALNETPGVELVASFGPVLGTDETEFELAGTRVLRDGGWEGARRAVEIFAVDGGEESAAIGTDAVPVVVGGPEDLLGLIEAGLLHDQPTQLAVDVDPSEPVPDAWVLTDGYQDRERSFGRVHDADSAVRTAGDERRTANVPQDYRLADGERWRTTARIKGASSVRASGSLSDATAVGGSRTAHEPMAALDGDPETEWISELLPDQQQWWQVDLDERRQLREVKVTMGRTGAPSTAIRVVSDQGQIGDSVVLRAGESASFFGDGSDVRWVKVEEDSTRPQTFSLAEVAIDDAIFSKELVLPVAPEEWGNPDAISLAVREEGRTGCLTVNGRTPCLESRTVHGEEPGGFRRVLTLAADRSYPILSMEARPRPGAALRDLLLQGEALTMKGSSTGPADVRASELAAFDGDPHTSWTPALRDAHPEISVNWPRKRRVTGLQLAVAPGAPVAQPRSVVVRHAGGEQHLDLDESGAGKLRPFRADGITVVIADSEETASVRADGSLEPLPVGVGELRIKGVDLTVQHSAVVETWPCGSGPDLQVNGQRVRTALRASEAQLSRMETVPVLACESRRGTKRGQVPAPDQLTVEMKAGPNAVRMSATPTMTPTKVTFGDAEGLAATLFPVAVEQLHPGAVELTPAEGATTVVRRSNTNPGWKADQGGARLSPVTIDGWQQGFRTSGAPDPVRAEFAPDRIYRWGLVIGGVCFVLMLSMLLIPRRRWPGAGTAPVGGRNLAVAVLAVAVLSGGVLAGWTGLLLSAVGALSGVLARRRLGVDAVWLGVLPVLAAGFGYYLRPWGSPEGWAGTSAWPHYSVLVALAFVAALGSGVFAGLRRRAGRSTKR